MTQFDPALAELDKQHDRASGYEVSGHERFRGVPEHAAVHPFGVQLDHCLVEIGEGAGVLGVR